MGWEPFVRPMRRCKLSPPALSVYNYGIIRFNMTAALLDHNAGQRACLYLDRDAKLLGVKVTEDGPYSFKTRQGDGGTYMSVPSILRELGIDCTKQKGKHYPVTWQDDKLVVDFSKTVDELKGKE